MKLTHTGTESILILFLIGLIAGCNTEIEETDDENTVVEHRKSPIVITTQKYEDTYIKIVYGQPYKRERAIFGELEPFGEVWRTGANEATEITLTDDIKMAGDTVEAGTYTLFTIPDPDEWTVILNTQLGQWGAFTYDPQFDYLRFKVPARETEEIVETLTITFDEIENNQTTLSIAWDDTRIDIPVEFL